MNTIRRVQHSFPFFKSIDWKLFLFLVLLLNVKLVVKLAAVLFIYLLRPQFRFELRFSKSRLPLFYPLLILIAIADTLLYRQFYQFNYLVVLCIGIFIWSLCLLAIHQIKIIVDNTEAVVIYRTLILFFFLNACVSLLQYAWIVVDTGALNPFRYQGEYQKYFISTGDYIKGVSFDTSTTNAVLNAMGIVFFLWKRSWRMVLICTCTLLLTASNMVNAVVYFLLFLIFLFSSSREQKSIILICFAFLAVFLIKVSPQNSQYVTEVTEKVIPFLKNNPVPIAPLKDLRELPDSMLTSEQQKEKVALRYLDSLKRVLWTTSPDQLTAVQETMAVAGGIKPTIPAPNIHAPAFQSRNDTNSTRRELLVFLSKMNQTASPDPAFSSTTLPGKAQAYLQTGHFLARHPHFLLTGTGLGNFSSKMAFKATGLQFAGGFPQQFSYINPDFSFNHLLLYLRFFTAPSKRHSITNSPNSVYDQLTSEYGLIGLAGLLVLYFGFFLKQYRKLSYGIPLLGLLLCFFFMDYWLEQLSVVVLFELLLFLNIKEKEQGL
jgi:hypothetical protein